MFFDIGSIVAKSIAWAVEEGGGERGREGGRRVSGGEKECVIEVDYERECAIDLVDSK